MTARTTARSLPDRQHLGQQLRDARNDIGMNQRQLAQLANIRQCSVSYIETAGRDVLVSSLVDAAAVAGKYVALAGEHHLPLLDLTADEVDALVIAARLSGLNAPSGQLRMAVLRSALDKLTTSTEEPS